MNCRKVFHLLLVMSLGSLSLNAGAQEWEGGGGRGNPPDPSPCISGATASIETTPSHVTLGQATDVHWSVQLPENCSAVQIRLDGGSVDRSGSFNTIPARATTFTLALTLIRQGWRQQMTREAHVDVSYPSVVTIAPETPSPVQVLIGALTESANDEQTVALCDVDLDLVGHSKIVLTDHRSLIAAPKCARGPRKVGPQLRVSRASDHQPLFQLRGDHIQISGFRLTGPVAGIASGDDNEKGIQIFPFESTEPIQSIEITNMEVSQWSGYGVRVSDNVQAAPRGRLSRDTVGAVRIAGSYFHHNRHVSEGYGVAVTDGAYALIEQNVFDQNRHAIAGGSRNGRSDDFSGYTVRDNLILKDGGTACGGWWIFNHCWQTHQIDMHGDQNQFYSNHNWQCGKAGETMLIQRNTILYTAGDAIKIRGNPVDKVVVDGNVFLGGRGSITQNGSCGVFGDNITNPIQVLPNNQFGGADPLLQELGHCDFAGDGQLDEFLTTGVTWWAKSPTTQQWRYLNTMPERLAQLQLQRVDADAVCDVVPGHPRPEVAPHTYSRSGTGPWQPVSVVHP